MKKRTGMLLLLLMLVLAGGCSPVEQIGKVREVLPWSRDEDAPYFDSFNEVKSYVKKQLENGMKEIVITTKELDTNEFRKINESFDGFYGTIKQCEIEEKIFTSKKKVTFTCDITDEYYVEAYLIDGQPIPEDRPEAEELAIKCQEIQEQLIDDLGLQESDYEKELWIHDYLVLKTAYGAGDESENFVHESYGALISHMAVCNGYAFAMKLLCDINSVACEIIVGEGDGEPHAWNQVKIEDEWYHLDVTWDDPTPDEEGRIIYTYFNVSDERAALGHSWIEDDYPAADSMKYNYYMENDLYCEHFDDFKLRCIDILEKGEQDQFQLMVADYDPGIYCDENMKFIFAYTTHRSFSYQNMGELPYMTIYIHLTN